jgi:three-Cys-motif partner protein
MKCPSSHQGEAVSNIILDEVGLWTEIKLQIIREYSAAYSTILKKQPSIRHFAYIDGFAGPGKHVSKTSGDLIDGSPVIALSHEFSHYHFVDLDGKRAANLRQLAAGRDDVSVYEGDCSSVLLEQVFPEYRFEDYRRALCLLDPYDLNPRWEVV